MDITFKTTKLQKVFNSERFLRKEYGALADTIMRRMVLLSAQSTLAEVSVTPPPRRHALSGNREGRFAIDLKHPYRLIFVPNHDPISIKGNKSIDLDKITAISIIEVVNYHPNKHL